MSHHEIELNVGDVVQIGEYTVTVVDLENGEVTFRIIEKPAEESVEAPVSPTRPR